MKRVVLSGALTLALVGLVGCESKQAKGPITPESAAENALKNPTPQDFSKPIITSDLPKPPNLPLATIPVKGLVQSTRAADRTNQAVPSGRDPFATVLPEGATLTNLTQFSAPQNGKSPTPVLKKATLKKSTSPKAKSRSKASQPLTQPLGTGIALRPGAPIPLSAIPPIQVSNNPLPAIPGAPIGQPLNSPKFAAPPSPTALADEVEVTGVIQVGGRVMAIVMAPDESTARYVNSGDTLSGGRVIVREIRVGQAGQPTVVLEQNGQRVTKSLGAIARMTSVRGL
jgi:hypothetical protein